MNYISGIQQIGIGVTDVRTSMLWYKEHFGMETLIFDDTSDATLMTRYTGGNVYSRQAVLSMNLQGGGGFEIWQFKSRKPSYPSSLPQYGDIGIYGANIKSSNVVKSYEAFQQLDNLKVSALQKDPKGNHHFWVTDPYNNIFHIISGNHWFQNLSKNTGGVTGAVIGSADIDKSVEFYTKVLGVDEIVYDLTGSYNDNPEGKPGNYRRLLLRKHSNGKGAFNKLLGSVEIELVQCLDRQPRKIFHDRFWGDCGFIHLCFDVLDMCGLKQHAEQHGYSFSVDSKDSFAMESAAGRFCYIEDPDGTLIELVETHKVPIFKKFGWYLDLKKRNLEKPLPDWIIKMLAFSKVK